MEFINLQDIRQVVEENAKYQKVMLVYDDSVSALAIANIFEKIKDLCIFNKMDFNNLNKNEINNGYKVLIFCCSADSYLKANLNVKDFVCIFVPADSFILPFFVQNDRLDCQQNFMILQNSLPDITILTSCYFNKFYNYFKNLLCNENVAAQFNFDIKNLNQRELIEILQKDDLQFEDLKILKHCNLNLCCLPVIDYLLMFAFLFLLQAVHCKSLTMVDTYKAMKEDYAGIDKYYALANNDAILQVINLNYFEISANLTKILKMLNAFLPFKEQLQYFNNQIFEKLKTYAKEQDCLLNLLYLFRTFGD